MIPSNGFSFGHSFLDAKNDASSTSTFFGIRPLPSFSIFLFSVPPALNKSGKKIDDATISTGTTTQSTQREDDEDAEELEDNAFGGFKVCFL